MRTKQSMETQLYNKLVEEGGKAAWELLVELTGGDAQRCINTSANVRTRYVMDNAHRREGYNEALLALAERAQGRDREILVEAAAASLKRQWDNEKFKSRPLLSDPELEVEYRKLRCCSSEEIYKFMPPKEMNEKQKERLEQGRSVTDPDTIEFATLLKMRDQAARTVTQFVRTGNRKLLYPAAKALQLITGRRTEEICKESTFEAVSEDQPFHLAVSDICKRGTAKFGKTHVKVEVVPCLGLPAKVVAEAVDLIQGMNYLQEVRGVVMAASTTVWGKGNRFEQPLLREWHGKLAWLTRDEHRWNENMTERAFTERVHGHAKGNPKSADFYDKTVVRT